MQTFIFLKVLKFILLFLFNYLAVGISVHNMHVVAKAAKENNLPPWGPRSLLDIMLKLRNELPSSARPLRMFNYCIFCPVPESISIYTNEQRKIVQYFLILPNWKNVPKLLAPVYFL